MMEMTRKAALEAGAVALGGVLVGGVVLGEHAEPALSRPSAKQDAEILNFALLLEYVQAAFYTEGLSRAGLTGELKEFASTVAAQEQEHIAFLKKALGSAAIKSPTFDFGKAVTDQATFAATAQVLEDTGVSAYLGQVGNISQKGVLSAAGTIATVEARHAAWIRFINKDVPAPAAFDTPKSEKAILKAVTATGFIK